MTHDLMTTEFLVTMAGVPLAILIGQFFSKRKLTRKCQKFNEHVRKTIPGFDPWEKTNDEL